MMEFLNVLGLLLLSAIRTSTPLILAAVGGSVCARSGVMAMGMEGFMLIAAFGAAWGSYAMQNAWLGLLVGIACGVLYSLIFAVPTLDHIKLPLVGDISVMVLVALASAVLLWAYLFKTPQGLHMRIVGENPIAAKTIGINTKKFKYLGVLICGLLCSLAGSFLSIDHVNRFVMDMTAGRGYIAVSVNILGRFNPLGAIAGGLLFGVADSLQNVVTSSSIPGQLLSMVPYVVTLLVISFAVRYVSSPAGMGKSED